jgi:hypothetical protein
MEDATRAQGSDREEDTETGAERPGDQAEPSDSLAQASERAGRTLEALRAGPAISLGFADLPARSLVALGIFIGVFMAAWMVLWAVMGGLGLGLGWLLAGAAGALAVKAYADRAD